VLPQPLLTKKFANDLPINGILPHSNLISKQTNKEELDTWIKGDINSGNASSIGIKRDGGMLGMS